MAASLWSFRFEHHEKAFVPEQWQPSQISPSVPESRGFVLNIYIIKWKVVELQLCTGTHISKSLKLTPIKKLTARKGLSVFFSH